MSAGLVLSVPSPKFEAALDELRGIGEEVTTDSIIPALVFIRWLVAVLLGTLAGWRRWARSPSADPGT